MKNKMLTLAMLFSTAIAVFTSCDNNSNKESSGSSTKNETTPGMGAVQTDTSTLDTVHTHSGMKENTTEVKK